MYVCARACARLRVRVSVGMAHAITADTATRVLAAVCPVLRQGKQKTAGRVPAEVIPARLRRHHVAKCQGASLLLVQNQALHGGHKAGLLRQLFEALGWAG